MAPSYIFEPTSDILNTNDAPDLLFWVGNSLESGAKLLLIDLREVTYIESSGLGTLMIAGNRVRRAGGTLALCSLNAQTRLQMERAGLLEKFNVYTNRQEFEYFILGEEDVT